MGLVYFMSHQKRNYLKAKALMCLIAFLFCNSNAMLCYLSKSLGNGSFNYPFSTLFSSSTILFSFLFFFKSFLFLFISLFYSSDSIVFFFFLFLVVFWTIFSLKINKILKEHINKNNNTYTFNYIWNLITVDYFV